MRERPPALATTPMSSSSSDVIEKPTSGPDDVIKTQLDDDEWEQVVAQPRTAQKRPEKRVYAPLFPDSPLEPLPSGNQNPLGNNSAGNNSVGNNSIGNNPPGNNSIENNSVGDSANSLGNFSVSPGRNQMSLSSSIKSRADLERLQHALLTQAKLGAEEGQNQTRNANFPADLGIKQPVLKEVGTAEVHPLQSTHSEISIMEALEREARQSKAEARLEKALAARPASPLPLEEHEDDASELEDEGERERTASGILAEETWNALAAEAGDEGPSLYASPDQKTTRREKKITINLREFGKGRSLNAILTLTPKQRQKASFLFRFSPTRIRPFFSIIPLS